MAQKQKVKQEINLFELFKSIFNGVVPKTLQEVNKLILEIPNLSLRTIYTEKQESERRIYYHADISECSISFLVAQNENDIEEGTISSLWILNRDFESSIGYNYPTK